MLLFHRLLKPFACSLKMELNKFYSANIYFFSSVLTSLINKEIVYGFGFRRHFLLTAIQSTVIATLSFCIMMKTGEKIKASSARRWLPTAGFLGAMIVSNMKALYYFDVSLYTLYKNGSIILVALLEQYCFGRRISPIGYGAFVIMICSSWTAEFGSRNSAVGYAWMATNIFATTAYVLHLKMLMDQNRSKIESVFYTNLLTIPILGILSSVLEREVKESHLRAPVLLLVAASSATALITAYSAAWTLKTLSSTAYSMLGASNKLCLSGAAIFWFNETRSPLKLLSLGIGVISGFVYSYDTSRQK
ncbi:hypothetical protein ECANGB1_2777 [Enterospora canceri]|uniref:GDP-mannose transporter n=1 Tax=Enterospora canceri TaxID=1081671 RepID=A0A1Y1S9H9_9MICR|nr:hypothetical protein ECANGB1_2777 [Enterospora canceri]